MGTESFPGINRPERDFDHLPLSRTEVKERVELYLYSPLWAFVASPRVKFTLLHIASRSCKTVKGRQDFYSHLLFYPVAMLVSGG